MDFLTDNQVSGDLVRMQRTDPRHMDKTGSIPKEQAQSGTGFGEVFTRALNGVNTLQQEGAAISQQMLTDPESVDPHDVTIAIAKANTSLQMAKTVVDSALKAYREIISIR